MKYTIFLLTGLFYLLVIPIQGFASNDQLVEKMVEEGEVNSLLLDMSATPSSIVGGAVNVITGSYFESASDLVIPGANPIALQRTYNSHNKDKGSLCHSWDLNLPSKATFSSARTSVEVYDRGTRLNFNESTDNYHSISDNDFMSVCIGKKQLSLGVTNCSKGLLNSRTNIRNREFHFTKNGSLFELHAESGEILTYSQKEKWTSQFDNYGIIDFVISTNKLSSGCLYKYSYDKKNRLDRVTSRGTKGNLLSYIEWIYPYKFKDAPRLMIRGSDGREVKYEYEKLKNKNYTFGDRYYLSSVKSKHAPNVLYKYSNVSSKFHASMVKKELPENRYLKVRYYKQGKNDVGSKYFYIANDYDSRIGRVSSLYEPAGVDKSPVMIWSFRYLLNQRSNREEELYGGITEVVDGLGHRKEYKFSNEQRLTSVSHFLDDDHLYRSERMIWEDEGEKKICLLAQGLTDSDENLVIRRDYIYDNNGNVVKESLRGNLTGRQCHPVTWDSFRDAEKYSTTFSYTDKGLLKTEDDGRKKTAYEYHRGTDLLTLKLVSNSERICERYHYKYDSNRVLIQEIFDDGDSSDITNLSGVTERRIKKITPTSTQPIGLAEIVEEYYLIPLTNQEKLTSRQENTYSIDGKLLCQKTYDCNGQYCFNKEWEYDEHGNVLKEIDPLGQITTYRYDQNDNRIFQQTPNLEYRTFFKYDYVNRLIAQKDVYRNGLEMVTSYSYDCMGNKISSTDKYGNTTQYRYDEFGRQIERVYPSVLDISGELVSRVDKIAYDQMNNPCEKTDANGNTTKILYTARGKPYLTTYPNGAVETNMY
nr:DUF6531 domain-containing protein [Parachlamydiaceae bacterium]